MSTLTRFDSRTAEALEIAPCAFKCSTVILHSSASRIATAAFIYFMVTAYKIYLLSGILRSARSACNPSIDT